MKLMGKKWTFLSALILTANSTFAAAETMKEALNNPLLWAFLLAMGLLVVTLMAFNKALDAIKFLSAVKLAKAEGLQEVKIAEEPSLMQSLTDAVPIERESEIMLDHDYDGIRELDNNLPPWWKYGFYLTIIWAVGYLIVYHVTGSAPLQDDEFKNSMAQAQTEVDAYLAKMGDMVDESNVSVLTQASDLKVGEDIFKSTCMACHAIDGGGNSIGPNLTDKYWINGDGSIAEIFKVIKYGGRPGTGMQSWSGDYGAKKMQQIASYVFSLRNTTPADPKAPEGDLYDATTTSAAADAETVDDAASENTGEIE